MKDANGNCRKRPKWRLGSREKRQEVEKWKKMQEKQHNQKKAYSMETRLDLVNTFQIVKGLIIYLFVISFSSAIILPHGRIH